LLRARLRYPPDEAEQQLAPFHSSGQKPTALEFPSTGLSAAAMATRPIPAFETACDAVRQQHDGGSWTTKMARSIYSKIDGTQLAAAHPSFDLDGAVICARNKQEGI
jgi:hypothetical protein